MRSRCFGHRFGRCFRGVRIGRRPIRADGRGRRLGNGARCARHRSQGKGVDDGQQLRTGRTLLIAQPHVVVQQGAAGMDQLVGLACQLGAEVCRALASGNVLPFQPLLFAADKKRPGGHHGGIDGLVDRLGRRSGG